jgi:hypothetical protein
MAHALETVAECEILRDHQKLTFRDGVYSYEILRDGNRSIYNVTDGKQAFTVPIGWALGLGTAGQTYVYRWNGNWYESHVSFFKQLQGLDLTIGTILNPKNLEEAAGRQLFGTEIRRCFACHATRALRQDQVDVEGLVPGVQCERCHGPAEHHVKAVQSGDVKAAAMRKLGSLTTEEMSDFCGGCHRTWAEIAMGPQRGVENVRFQPYRLTNSRCYNALDARIRCTACHDPHREVERESAAYDVKCLACHTFGSTPAVSGAKAKAAGHPGTCPVATKDCASCHMPRYEIPGTHNRFTDHWIRVIKSGEPYPG